MPISKPFLLHVNWTSPSEAACDKVVNTLRILAECQEKENGVITYAFWRKGERELEWLEIYADSKAFWSHSSSPKFLEAFKETFLSDSPLKESASTHCYGVVAGADTGVDQAVDGYLQAVKPITVIGSFWGRKLGGDKPPLLLIFDRLERDMAEKLVRMCLPDDSISTCVFDEDRGFIICPPTSLIKIESVAKPSQVLGPTAHPLQAGYIHRNFSGFAKKKAMEKPVLLPGQAFWVDNSVAGEAVFHFPELVEEKLLPGYIPLRTIVRNFTNMKLADYVGEKYLYFILGRLRGLDLLLIEYNKGIDLDPLENYSVYHHRYIRYQIMSLISGFGFAVKDGSVRIVVTGLVPLIEEIESLYTEKIKSHRSLISEGNVVFDALQELYTPGAILRGMTSLGVPSGFKVIQCYYQEHKTLFGYELSFHVDLQYVVTLGGDFGVVECSHVMSRWMGEAIRKISELYFAPAEAELLEKFQSIGARYAELGGLEEPKYLQHDAGSVFLHSNRNSSTISTKPVSAVLNSSGRVLIDVIRGSELGHHASRGNDEVTLAYLALNTRYRRFVNENKSLGTKVDNPEGLFILSKVPKELYSVCWPALVGFSFSSKTWCHVLVAGLKEIVFNDKAFDELVLDSSRKRLIRALVRFGGEQFEDIIEGKSGGSIFLLHGKPGVGKTLTAEAIAEVLHQPLYYVTMGELGTDPETMERRLGEILGLCSGWNALVLIDEADVFLEKRSTSDVLRNAMVCVMLRLIEYHQGILFLTTNRVTEFDPAFESRVTIALKYDSLSESARKQIWKNLTGRLTCDRGELDFDKLAKYVLNGRQIKNAIRLASALALDSKKPLDQEICEETIAITNTGRLEMEKAEKY